ncbi:hypothetical protein D3C71_859390 [compost metagenome]
MALHSVCLSGRWVAGNQRGRVGPTPGGASAHAQVCKLIRILSCCRTERAPELAMVNEQSSEKSPGHGIRH